MSDDGTTAPVRDEPRTGNDRHAAAIAEHERQFREILEYCPAGLNVVDEDGRLLFHNARLRKLLGYDEEEMHLFDTQRFWHDLDPPASSRRCASAAASSSTRRQFGKRKRAG